MATLCHGHEGRPVCGPGQEDEMKQLPLLLRCPTCQVPDVSSNGPARKIWDAAQAVTSRHQSILPRRCETCWRCLPAGTMQAKPLAPGGASSCDARHIWLADEALRLHVGGSLTLVVCNRVTRAQAVLETVRQAASPNVAVRLVRFRFRPAERKRIQSELLAPGWSGILVTTQVIEAGVDISARALFTEIAGEAVRARRCRRRRPRWWRRTRTIDERVQASLRAGASCSDSVTARASARNRSRRGQARRAYHETSNLIVSGLGRDGLVRIVSI
jgi:hypothetical protein